MQGAPERLSAPGDLHELHSRPTQHRLKTACATACMHTHHCSPVGAHLLPLSSLELACVQLPAASRYRPSASRNLGCQHSVHTSRSPGKQNSDSTRGCQPAGVPRQQLTGKCGGGCCHMTTSSTKHPNHAATCSLAHHCTSCNLERGRPGTLRPLGPSLGGILCTFR